MIAVNALLLSLALIAHPVAADTSYLYRVLLLRAAPGSLLELMDQYRERLPVYEAAGDETPFILRHRQGDQWDLMLLFPVVSFERYYGRDRAERLEGASTRSMVSEPEFQRTLGDHIAWREELFAFGPPPSIVRPLMDGGALFHIEMFIALPAKREELFRQREMENAYYANLDRPQNLIFTRAAGAAWDVFTLGVYRDLADFAVGEQIPGDRQDTAAKAAGFEASNRIGTYLRTLIQSHHDTLAGRVR